MPNPPYTDPAELDPHTKAAREFADLVGNMLEEKLGPIRERLRIIAYETARANQALAEMAVLKADVEALKARCPLCSTPPRDSMSGSLEE